MSTFLSALLNALILEHAYVYACKRSKHVQKTGLEVV